MLWPLAYIIISSSSSSRSSSNSSMLLGIDAVNERNVLDGTNVGLAFIFWISNDFQRDNLKTNGSANMICGFPQTHFGLMLVR